MTGAVWYPIRVTSQKESVAALLLKEAGVATYLPSIHKLRRFNRIDRRRRWVPTPLFPTYLFVGFTTVPEPWWRVFEVRLVHGVVGSNGHPRAVSEAEMACVYEHVEADLAKVAKHGGAQDKYALPKIEPGDRVKLVLAGIEFRPKVERVRNRELRLILDRPFMGLTKITVPLTQVEIA